MHILVVLAPCTVCVHCGFANVNTCSLIIAQFSFLHAPEGMELLTAEGEAHHLLTESLPMYVVKCFTAAGFDTIDVISKMDVSTEPGNSIEQIEQYISNEYPDSKSKKFPPGHRLRIQQFVDSVKKRVSLGKRPHSRQRSDGRKKTRVNSSEDTFDVDQGKWIADIRQQICKWLRVQTNDNVKKVKESEHYEVLVTTLGIGHVRCLMCLKSFQLGKKKDRFLISNWSCHVTKCVGRAGSQTLLDFTSSLSSASSPSSQTDKLHEIPVEESLQPPSQLHEFPMAESKSDDRVCHTMAKCSALVTGFQEECIREEIPAQSRDEWSFMCTSCNMQSS